MTEKEKKSIARAAAREASRELPRTGAAPGWLPDEWLVRFAEKYAFLLRCAQKKEERDQDMRMNSD